VMETLGDPSQVRDRAPWEDLGYSLLQAADPSGSRATKKVRFSVNLSSGGLC
jgi:hypothetical protein